MALLVLSLPQNMESSPNTEVLNPESSVVYAGFWLRLVAALVDALVMFIPFCFIAFIVTVVVKFVSATKGYEPASAILTVLPPVTIVAAWLYFAVMESSPWQATLGKKLLGLYVTDIKGQRLSLIRATGRTFAKYLSAVTAGVGYLLCGFTEKKQALHDIVASCVVLRGSR